MLTGVNVGSGQRRFESTEQVNWINVDIVSRPPDQIPDIICDIAKLPQKLGSYFADFVVAHHICEHFGCGEFPFRACFDLLKPGGSLIVCVPDIRALASRWLAGGISDYIYLVNMMGAFQGLDTDRHRWHFTHDSFVEEVKTCGKWQSIDRFDFRTIPGASICKDWWILGMEARK